MNNSHVIVFLLVTAFSIFGCSSTNVKSELDFGKDKAHSSIFNKGKAAYLSKDYPLALGLLKEEAVKGDADAQYAVGYMMYYGQGIAKNQKDALFWIRKAAESGNERAFRALAIMSRLGEKSDDVKEIKDEKSTQ